MGSLKNFQTIKSHKDFVRVYNSAKKWHSNSLTLFYIKKDVKNVGFTVTKKIGNAVVRNRTKRRLRALFLEFMDRLENGTYIIVSKQEIVNTNYEDLKRDLKYTFKKLNVLQKAE